jgi:hypothetical protein
MLRSCSCGEFCNNADANSNKQTKRTEFNAAVFHRQLGKVASQPHLSLAVMLVHIWTTIVAWLLVWPLPVFYAGNSTSASQLATVTVDPTGTIHIDPGVDGRDVVFGGVSVLNLVSQLRTMEQDAESLKSSLVQHRVDHASLKETNNALSHAVSSVEAQNLALLAFKLTISGDPWRSIINTCAISRQPIVAPTVFNTFATFAFLGQTYAIACVSSLCYFLSVTSSAITQRQLLPAAVSVISVSAFNAGSTQYVAIPNYSTGGAVEGTNLYVFDPTSSMLVSSQNISTSGATGVSAITFDNVSYLAISNENDPTNINNTYSAQSFIMRYNSSSLKFEHWQNISTFSAHPPHFFIVGSDLFLAVPFNYNGKAWVTQSEIYVFDRSMNAFVRNQSISTNACRNVKTWVHNGHTYMAVVNFGELSTDIYKYNFTTARFENITTGMRLYVQAQRNPLGVDVTTIFGDVYMALTIYEGYARVYVWNDALTRFDILQDFSVVAGYLFPSFFVIGGDTFLLIGGKAYKFCGSSFVLA